MRNIVFILSFLLTNMACSQKPGSQNEVQDHQDSPKKITTQSHDITDTVAVKNWITAQINDYFNTESPKNMEEITTKAYSNFKNDAMNVGLDLDISLTENEFIQKYKDKYDLKTHPILTGFLISGQDWGNIIVERCVFKEFNTNKDRVVFKTTINDNEFNVKYDRDIIILSQNGKFLIDDIIEYN